MASFWMNLAESIHSQSHAPPPHPPNLCTLRGELSCALLIFLALILKTTRQKATTCRSCQIRSMLTLLKIASAVLPYRLLMLLFPIPMTGLVWRLSYQILRMFLASIPMPLGWLGSVKVHWKRATSRLSMSASQTMTSRHHATTKVHPPPLACPLSYD